MKRPVFQIALTGVLLVLCCAIGVFWWGYRALRQVAPFYVEALAQPIEELEQASHELETQAGAFYSDTQTAGSWSGLFTQMQINGWLQTQLMGDLSHLIPNTIRDPRIAITPDEVRLGFRNSESSIETVITIVAKLFLTDEDQIAIRLREVRAGALKLPVWQVAEKVREASKDWSVPIRWVQVDGDAVALVDLEELVLSDGQHLKINVLELHDAELFIAGQTESAEKIAEEEVLPLF